MSESMLQFQRLMGVRIGGATERCHGISHQGSYSVAAHTWGVLALLYIIWPEDFPRLSPKVMFHDVPEAWIGDIPAPTKKYNTQVKDACDRMELAIFERLNLPNDQDVSGEDAAKMKACDHLELYLWACEQVYGGNQHASCVVREVERFFKEKPLPDKADQLYRQIKNGSVEHATDRLIMELNR